MRVFSAAGPGSSALTALPALGLLDSVYDNDCAALGRKAFPLRQGFGGQVSARRFRPFAPKTRALSGLGDDEMDFLGTMDTNH